MPARVVIPWRDPDCPHRRRALSWVLGKHERSGLDVRIGLAPDGPWVKSEAVMPYVIQAPPESIMVVADADVWTKGIPDAIQAVEDGAGWAIPHRGVMRLTKAATMEATRGARNWEALDTERPWYLGTEGGGIVVARRETLLQIPLDPRFLGWGQEDESWGIALRCLAGPPHRVKTPLIHLYHPPQDRLTLRKGNMASWALHRRYLAARYDPDAMRRLLAEIV